MTAPRLSPAVTARERLVQIADYTRLYWRQGHVAHLMPGYSASVRSTMCGEGPDSWMLGTGSQAEYDRAARLPTCKRCLSASEAES